MIAEFFQYFLRVFSQGFVVFNDQNCLRAGPTGDAGNEPLA